MLTMEFDTLSSSRRGSSYMGLIREIKRFYADGLVTNAELEKMKEMRSDTLLNYQVASDLLHKMDKTAPGYDKLKSLTDYFRRCWVLMDFVTDRSRLWNKESNNKKVLGNPNILPEKKETLTLNVSDRARALLSELSTPEKRREASRSDIEAAVSKMPRETRDRVALEIVRSLQAMRQADLDKARENLLALERTRG